MYQHLTKLFLAVLVAAVLSLAALGQASAQGTPDFSECVELRGPALGLCEAGVQIDCLGDEFDPPACAHITDAFERLTGESLPWVIPCPCDYNQMSKALEPDGPWGNSGYLSIRFECAAYPDVGPMTGQVQAVRLIDIYEDLPYVGVFAQYNTITGDFVSANCQVRDDNGIQVVPDVNSLTLEEARSCRKEVISYGTAFDALHPELGIPLYALAEAGAHTDSDDGTCDVVGDRPHGLSLPHLGTAT